jgi:NADPH:quinone reductase-like Zn-dependent oxidoreductase
MATNTAAWLTAPKARPFKLRNLPLPTPTSHQILIKNRAIAVNPIDGKIQALAFFPLQYPTILGQDVAGEIVAVGSDVTRFKIGDRVAGCAPGSGSNEMSEKAFQAYTILRENMACGIPNHMPSERAVVLPLGVCTASCGLFHPDFLELSLPTWPKRESTGKALLVWGGASSVGSNAIQLATSAGYDVIATASAKNFDHVKSLGATVVVDYQNPDVVANLMETIKDRNMVGAFDAIGGLSWAPLIELFSKVVVANPFIATVLPNFPTDLLNGIVIKQVQALYIMDNHVSKAIWEDFLPNALEEGSYVPAPPPQVVGQGLGALQDAVDLQMQGMSARKAVVVLE